MLKRCLVYLCQTYRVPPPDWTSYNWLWRCKQTLAFQRLEISVIWTIGEDMKALEWEDLGGPFDILKEYWGPKLAIRGYIEKLLNPGLLLLRMVARIGVKHAKCRVTELLCNMYLESIGSWAESSFFEGFWIQFDLRKWERCVWAWGHQYTFPLRAWSYFRGFLCRDLCLRECSEVGAISTPWLLIVKNVFKVWLISCFFWKAYLKRLPLLLS